MSISIRSFLAGDVVQLELQPSQHMALGMLKAVHSIEDGRLIEASGPAWSVIGDDGRILCCYGFAFQHPPSEGFGGHALAWAMLAAGVGAAHHAITRFARRTIADSDIGRIEAIVRADAPAEANWARLVGLELVAELRCWGPEGRTHLLFERIREPAALREAA